MKLKHCALALGLLAAASLGSARAAVTITESTVDFPLSTGTETVPVYVLENQWLKILIIRGPVQHPTITGNTEQAIGQVLALYKKTGTDQTHSQLSTLATTSSGSGATGTPAISQARSYITGRNRMNSQDQLGGSQTISSSVDPGGALGTITVDMKSNYPTTATVENKFGIQMIYRLRDNAKWYETELTWTNPSATDYVGSGGTAPTSYYYVTPGGSGGTSAPGDLSFAKTATGLAANNISLWFGASGSPNGGSLTEGWLAWVDPDADVATVATWDLAKEQEASPAGTVQRAGWFSNRVTIELYYNTIPAGGSLNYTQNMIVDDDITSVSYAKEGQIVAGIELDKTFLQHYSIGDPITATIQLNSLDPANAQTYSVRNLRVEAVDQFGTSPSITIPDVSNVSIPSNEHSATNRTFNLTDPALEPSKQYVIKGELYKGSDSTPITTLSSRAFFTEAPGTKVYLYEDTSTNAWILENEVYWVRIGTASSNMSQVTHLVAKNANNRNQTITSSPPHPLFRDFVQPVDNATAFGGYGIPTVVDNTPTRKSIAFGANGPGTVGGQLTKTYALDSMSSALEVGYKFVNGSSPLQGGGIFSDVEMAPSGSFGGNNRFFAHTTAGLTGIHPETVPAFERHFFGETWDPTDPTVGIPGDYPELDQGWMSVVNTGSLDDANVLAWDLPTQKNFSLPMKDTGTKVTMNSMAIAANYDRHVIEARFTNIPANGTLDTKYYFIADTGYKVVSYTEVGRVMAGIWPTSDANVGATLSVASTITNIGTTSRTFDLKNIRISDGTTETVVGTDQTGIALTAATRDSRTLSLAIPAGQAEGTYRVLVDLYEGATKVATLETLPFNIVAVVTPTGDINNDTKVDAQDAALALSIAGGLTEADAGQVSRGDLVTGSGITIEDAVAIAKKANG